MSSLIECIAETQKYFIDNWTDTPIQIDGMPFDNSTLDQYIQIRYTPIDDESLMGRTTSTGILQVYCYHKIKNLAAVLADDVREFAGDKDLPKGIALGCGKNILIEDLDNGFWLVLLHFKVNQFV